MCTFSISWADNFTPGGGRGGVLCVDWDDTWLRDEPGPAAYQGRANNCPCCPCDFPRSVNWYKNSTKTAPDSCFPVRSEMNDSEGRLGIIWGKTVKSSVAGGGSLEEERGGGGGARNDGSVAFTQWWRSASRWSRRHGCRRRRPTFRQRRRPDWGCGDLSDPRSCWLDPRACSEQSQEEHITSRLLQAIQHFVTCENGHHSYWLYANMISLA